MRLIPVAAVPNQSFTVTLDGVRWGFRLIDLGESLAVDVEKDGTYLVRGVRVLAGETLIPYRRLSEANFIFVKSDDALPDWANLGILVYLDRSEMSALPPAASVPPDLQYLFDDAGFYLTTDAGELLTNA